MKKIRSVLLVFISILSVIVLASCGSKAKIDVINVSTMRTRIGITIKVNDPDNDITKGSIVASLYNSDDDLVSSLSFNELAEEEETKTFDSLKENTSYRIVLKATIDDKSVTFLKKNYTTSSTGKTEADPIVIDSVQDFKDITYDNDAYYRLDADLDFSGVDGKNGDFTPLFNNTKQFKGHLDGNGHKIANMYISNTNVYNGIFGYIGFGASVKNLTIDNVELKSTKGSELYLGTLAGCSEGTLDNVTVKNIKITHEGSGSSKQYIGGLVGVNTNIIKNCNVVNVEMNLRSRLQSIVGGLVGTNGGIVHTPKDSAYVENCSATDINITTKHEATRSIPKDEEDKEYIQYTGLFVGETRIDIKDSYASGSIKSTAKFVKESYIKVYTVAVGGFAGRAINGSKISGVAVKATIDASTEDAYRFNAGVIVGAAFDAIITDSFGMLAGENSFVSKSDYKGLSDDIKEFLKDETFAIDESATQEEDKKIFEKLVDVVAKQDKSLVNDPVSKVENIGYKLLTGATVAADTEESTGHLSITSLESNIDVTKLSAAVKAFIESCINA